MQSLTLIADVTLPAMAGASTKDIAAIQKNILAIQQVFNRKIYSPGDIGNTRVLVITGVYHFVCIIHLRLLELTGYMSFINCQKTEFEAMGVLRVLCPVPSPENNEMERRFTAVFNKIKFGSDAPQGCVTFVSTRILQHVELAF